MNNVLKIDPALEKSKITSFIRSVLKREGFKKVVIGMSGGVDSATAFYLLKEAIAPENIIVAHLYYLDSPYALSSRANPDLIGRSRGISCNCAERDFSQASPDRNDKGCVTSDINSQFKDIEGIIKKAGIPKENVYEMSIDPFVKLFHEMLALRISEIDPRHPDRSASWRRVEGSFSTAYVERDSSASPRSVDMNVASLGMTQSKIRLGNIMARIRMIILYDLAKKHNALVCGTENKSEFLLGYFTRFGDHASDFEPFQHLYKTQVYALANFLNVPKNIIEKTPTAGLWHGQTDEAEFGFSYKEADEVLFYYYDKKLKLEEIKKKGFANAEKVINFSLKNAYKHRTPFTLSTTNTNTKYH